MRIGAIKTAAVALAVLEITTPSLEAAPTAPLKRVMFRDAKSDLLHSTPPIYPFEASAHGIRGSGIFELRLRKDGTVAQVWVFQSTQDVLLDRAATTALIQWRFRPGMYESVKVPVTFSHSRAQIQTNFLPRNPKP